MRDLRTLKNVNPADSDFPSGRVRDNPGDNTGTPVNEALLGDMTQFFMKLIRDAGITPNNLPDSEYPGYQLYEALQTLMLPGEWTALTIDSAFNDFGSPYYNASYQIDNPSKLVKLRGVIQNAGGLSSPQLVGTLPAAARPLGTVILPIVGETTIDSTAVFDFLTIIASTGQMILYNPQAATINNIYSLDSVPAFSIAANV